MKNIFVALLILLLAFFTFLMVRITADYFPVQKDVAFLQIKQWVFRTYAPGLSSAWFVAFYIHVITATFCLLAGFTQFFKRFLYTGWHRFFGRFYVVVVLCFAAPSGLIMSFFANGGILSVLAFILLSVLWIATTAMAFKTARQKKFQAHGAWMILSYALALSALTLRAWKWSIVNLTDLELNPMVLYRLVAWLGWVPNFLFALILIRLKIHHRLIKNPEKNLTKRAKL